MTNSSIDASRLIEKGLFYNAALVVLRRASEWMALPGRGFVRALRVARTVAGIAGREEAGEEEMLEALSYRSETDAGANT